MTLFVESTKKTFFVNKFVKYLEKSTAINYNMIELKSAKAENFI